VVDAKLALDVLGGDSAARARDEEHDVEPVGQRSRRLREDRPGGRVNVVAAAGAGPRLPLLLRRVPLEAAFLFALRTVGVFAVRRVTLTPEVGQTGLVVGELGQELAERVERLRRGGALRIVAVRGRHFLPLSVESASDSTAPCK